MNMCNMEQGTKTSPVAETWVPVRGFEGLYEVSDLGRVRSLDRWISVNGRKPYLKKGQILTLTPNSGRRGYLRVALSDGHRNYTHIEVHRLVALHFVDGYHPGLVVNHKNEIKTDNRAINLEWCTYQYNLNYSDVVSWKRKTVYQYDLQGNYIAEHKCCADVERMLGEYQGAMVHVMYESKRGEWKGYLWSYDKRTKEEWQTILKKHKSSRRAVAQYTDDGTEIARYKTMAQAADKYGVSASAIYHCCRGNSLKCAGYNWRYID